MRNLLLLACSLITIGIIFSACTNDSSGGEESGYPSGIVIASGPQTGGWYGSAAAFSEILMNEIDTLNVTVTEGGGIENVRLINEGEDAQIGYTWSSFLDDAENGVNGFEEDGQLENVAAIGSIQQNNIYIVVKADSDIHDLTDLNDKRIMPGTANSGGEFVFRSLMEINGITYDDIASNGGDVSFTGYGDASSLMKDGHIDAFLISGPARHNVVMEVESDVPVRILSIGDDTMNQFLEENPGFGKSVIPSGTYEGHESDSQIVASYTTVFANNDLSEDFIYDISKLLFESRDELANVNSDFEFISEENWLTGIEEDQLHPGALKFYEEEIKN